MMINADAQGRVTVRRRQGDHLDHGYAHYCNTLSAARRYLRETTRRQGLPVSRRSADAITLTGPWGEVTYYIDSNYLLPEA